MSFAKLGLAAACTLALPVLAQAAPGPAEGGAPFQRI